MEIKMKKLIPIMLVLALAFIPVAQTFAREGDCGYEGGISALDKAIISTSGTNNTSQYKYTEVCFLTGEPVIFKGALTVKKIYKGTTLTTTYIYNLQGTKSSKDTLTRTLVYTTVFDKQDNGQIIESTSMNANPVEAVKIGSAKYTLSSYVFSRTTLIDPKPAVSYYGNSAIKGCKTYTLSSSGTSSASAASGTETVNITSSITGYDNYWGSTEVVFTKYSFEGAILGFAETKLTSSTYKQLVYVTNDADVKSLDGGYIQSQDNDSKLEYTYTMPKLDSSGKPTNTAVVNTDRLGLETFPDIKSLPMPDLTRFRGHPLEDDIRTLWSLGVFKGNTQTFDPDRNITRAQFAAALAYAAPSVPPDPASVSTIKTTVSSRTAKTKIVSPFSDIPIDYTYFSQINDVNSRGIMTGKKDGLFMPDDDMTMAEVLTVSIRALGLDRQAPNPAAITLFKDNDKIPSYARNSAYAAYQIGLVQPDDAGYLHPEQKITVGQAAQLLNKLIAYMRDGLRKEYGEKMVSYDR